jgi:hypothetical protein
LPKEISKLEFSQHHRILFVIKQINWKLLSDLLAQYPGKDLKVPENLVLIDNDLLIFSIIGSFISRPNTKVFVFSKSWSTIKAMETIH